MLKLTINNGNKNRCRGTLTNIRLDNMMKMMKGKKRD